MHLEAWIMDEDLKIDCNHTSFNKSENWRMKRLHTRLLYVPLTVITGSSDGTPLVPWFSSFLPTVTPSVTLSSPMALNTIYVWQPPNIYIQLKPSPKLLLTYLVAYRSFPLGCLSNGQLQTELLIFLLPCQLPTCSAAFLIIVHGTFILPVTQTKNFSVSLICSFSGGPSKIWRKSSKYIQNLLPLYTSTSITLYLYPGLLE